MGPYIPYILTAFGSVCVLLGVLLTNHVTNKTAERISKLEIAREERTQKRETYAELSGYLVCIEDLLSDIGEYSLILSAVPIDKWADSPERSMWETSSAKFKETTETAYRRSLLFGSTEVRDALSTLKHSSFALRPPRLVETGPEYLMHIFIYRFDALLFSKQFPINGKAMYEIMCFNLTIVQKVSKYGLAWLRSELDPSNFHKPPRNPKWFIGDRTSFTFSPSEIDEPFI